MSRAGARFWALVVISFGITATALDVARVPSPSLLAGVVAGLGCALFVPRPQKLPRFADHLSLAIVGVVAGSMLDRSVVDFVLRQPAATVGSTAATLVVTLATGQALRLSRHVGGSTALLSSVAGGAAALTGLAREIGADEAVVVSVQYLRVLLVILTLPAVAPLLGGTQVPVVSGSAAQWSGAPFTAVSLVGGLVLARIFSFTASRLIFPLLVSAVLSATSMLSPAVVPEPLQTFAFALIGLMVGLDLTPATVRRIASFLPLALAVLAIGFIGCALVGVLLAHATGASALSGYLATTPGGLPAVMAFAIDSKTDVGLVLTCQILRLFSALLLGVAVATWIQRRRR